MRKNGKVDYSKQCIACRDFKRNHGFTLTPEDRAKLNAEPWCHICRSEDDLVIDHNHETNEVRHYLCRTCNTGLGNFHDNINKLERAILYLQENAVQQKETRN